MPSARTVALIQDKFAQKEHFAAKGVPLAAFCALRSERDVADAAARFGFPLVVKSRRLAYDGRGNATARTAEELPGAIAALGGLGCVALQLLIYALLIYAPHSLTPHAHPVTARSCMQRRGHLSLRNWRSWWSALRRGSW